MKKKSLLAMCCAAFLLTGCGGDDVKVIEGGPDAENTKQESNESSDESVSTVAQSGYVFSYNGVDIAVDADAALVVDALGEPDSYFEAASCAFEGLDKVYTYASFEIETYPQGDKDYISSIVFKDDSVTTKEGICIGDSASKLADAYGSEGAEEVGKIVYEKDGMELCFIVDGDSIVSIEYVSTVLQE